MTRLTIGGEMHSSIYSYLKRDGAMRAQEKEVLVAKEKLVKQGDSPRAALKKIKKAFINAIKSK